MAILAHKRIGSRLHIAAITAVFAFSFLFTACGSVMDRLTGNTASNSAASNSTAASNTTETAANSTSSTTQPDTSANAPAGNCSLDYYPVSAAKQTKYKIAGSGSDTYTLAQSAITENGFIETRTFSSGLTVTNNWVCESEGIRTAEFTNTGVMKNANFTMETVKSDGVTLPRVPTPGKEFEANYDLKVNVAAGPVKANATGKANVKSKVVAADENLNVNGTDYQTVKIESVIKINLTVSGRGYEAASVKTTNWFAPGVGLVKQVADSTLGDETITIDN